MADDKDKQEPKKPRSTTSPTPANGLSPKRTRPPAKPSDAPKPRRGRVTKAEAKEATDKIDEGFIAGQAKQVTDDDVKRVVDRADEIKRKFEKGGPLGRFINDVQLLIAIVKDFARGNYREIPYLSIGAIVFTLLYVLNPFDLIPDVIPVIGQLDDAAVVGICLIMVEQDLHEYREWKKKQAEDEAANAAA